MNMKEALIEVTFYDGRRVSMRRALDDRDRSAFATDPDQGVKRAEELTLEGLLRHGAIADLDRDLSAITSSWSLRFVEDEAVDSPTDSSQQPSNPSLAKCRSMLELAAGLLPQGERDDAFEEWVDEIETAASEGLPIFRRTCSIVCRSLPALVLRARLPRRAPRGGS